MTMYPPFGKELYTITIKHNETSVGYRKKIKCITLPCQKGVSIVAEKYKKSE